MGSKSSSVRKVDHRARSARLGFRVDKSTKNLVERAAYLERQTLTDYCLHVLGDAAKRSIARHENLVLSERDRSLFFDLLVHPPKASARLKRAVKAERERIER